MFLTRNIKKFINLLNKQRNFSTNRACEEIRIPSQCGDLDAKWWGPHDTKPILAFHGWQDNCGSFDKLIPLLPSHIGFLAIDLPGHGLSSRIPKGMYYHSIDSNMLIKQIIKYFNWPKVALLGHSLGAMISFIYTMLFPEEVDFLICLDCMSVIHEKYNKPQYMAETIDKFLKYDHRNNMDDEPPSYTFKELEQMWHVGSKQSIDIEVCKYVLQRNIAPSKINPDKYYLTRDPRLKVGPLMQWEIGDILKGAERIKCPILLTLSNNSPLQVFKLNYLKTLDAIKKQNQNVEFYEINGTHHVHLNAPELLEGVLSKFIKKYVSVK